MSPTLENRNSDKRTTSDDQKIRRTCCYPLIREPPSLPVQGKEISLLTRTSDTCSQLIAEVKDDDEDEADTRNVGHSNGLKFHRVTLETRGLGRRKRDVRSVAYDRHPLVDHCSVF